MKQVSMSFYKQVCKICPLFQEFIEENPKGRAIIECEPFICPILWEEGFENLTEERKQKLLSKFSEEEIEILRKNWLVQHYSL